jgi:hypothetical protein
MAPRGGPQEPQQRLGEADDLAQHVYCSRWLVGLCARAGHEGRGTAHASLCSDPLTE